MSVVAGIDYSTHAVDVVLLEEDTDRATWHRFELTGQDAFERARAVRNALRPGWALRFDDVLAVGIEEPRGHGAGSLYRIQGAILACIPRHKLVQPWVPSAWRKHVGLPGNASKDQVRRHAINTRTLANGTLTPWATEWPQDAWDAYLIALATRQQLHRAAA